MYTPHFQSSTPGMPVSLFNHRLRQSSFFKIKTIQVTSVKNRCFVCVLMPTAVQMSSGRVLDVPVRQPDICLPYTSMKNSWLFTTAGVEDSTNKLSRYTEKFQLLKISGELHSNTSSSFDTQNCAVLPSRLPTENFFVRYGLN